MRCRWIVESTVGVCGRLGVSLGGTREVLKEQQRGGVRCLARSWGRRHRTGDLL